MAILLASLYVYRVKTISNKKFYPKEVYYSSKTEVSFENDFFDNIQNNMNGYTVTVLDDELLTTDEFVSKYKLQDNMIFPQNSHVFVVKANFKNKTDELSNKHGINLAQFILQDNAFMTYASKDLISAINENTNYTFSLMPNSDQDILIPFCINPNYISIDRLKKRKANIVITLYPNKKIISLKNKYNSQYE